MHEIAHARRGARALAIACAAAGAAHALGGGHGDAPDAPSELPTGFETTFGATQDEHDHAGGRRTDRADGHAPIGVMGDHVHDAGHWMVSLRYMHMSMEGNRDGTSSLSTQDVFDLGYRVAPVEMTTDMLMLGLMYAPTDRLTLMGMLPYVRKSMDHELNPALTPGGSFTTDSEGLGDLRLSALYAFVEADRHRAHWILGVGIPTGSTDERDDLPGMPDAKLPYPMQLGSGSFELIPGVTYNGQSTSWSWGAQVSYDVRLNENDEDYTLGNQFDATAWGARRLSDSFSSSLRLAFADWENIDGQDPELPTLPGPPGFPVETADPELRGGKRLDVGIGLNSLVKDGALAGNRFAIELLLPIYQDLDGPQLETDWTLVAGWQLAF